MKKHSKVFVPVSDKKFEDSKLYIVIGEEWSITPFEVMALNGRLYDVDFKGDDGEYNTDVTDYVTHWLEEKENVYVLTEQEYDAVQKENKELKEQLEKLTKTCNDSFDKIQDKADKIRAFLKADRQNGSNY